MKSSIAKALVATAIGLITATSAAYAGPGPRHETTMEKFERGTAHLARETWRDSKDVGRTVVHSPVIAWEVARGERPLFPHETAARQRDHREQIALTGHRAKSRAEMNVPRHYDPPI